MGTVRRWQLWTLLTAITVAVLAVYPEVVTAALAVLLISMAAAAAARLLAAWTARRGHGAHPEPHAARGSRLFGRRAPFVSIHVPICNEPPALVCRTLDSLARLDYSRFEVLVVDNNTKDPAVWRPVEAHCRRLGRRFRFVHLDELEGAKAGALNLCRLMTHPATDVIAVVDADYRVEPDLLRRARRHLESGAAFVQFPQAYANGTPGSAGLRDGYASYFDALLPFADHSGCPLLTGTLCLVRLDALDAAGGWSPATLTEDAELGLRLNLVGAHGRYVGEIAGRGLMPTHLSALRKQRRRWVYGNAQTLAKLRARDLKRLGPRRALAVLLQLTAWFDLLYLPVVVLLAGAWLPTTSAHTWAASLAAAALLVHIGAHAAVHALAPSRLTGAPRSVWRTTAVQLALSWEGSTAWIEALAGLPLRFERTDKSSRRSEVREVLLGIGVAALAVVSAVAYAFTDQLPLALVTYLAAAAAGCVLYLHGELSGVARVRGGSGSGETRGASAAARASRRSPAPTLSAPALTAPTSAKASLSASGAHLALEEGAA